MPDKVLRRCDICGKFHAAYLVPNPKGGQMKVCQTCWKNLMAPKPDAPAKDESAKAEKPAE